MQYRGLKALTASGKLRTLRGPVALLIAEDDAEVDSTIRHHREKGFRHILLFGPEGLGIGDGGDDLTTVEFPTLSPGATPTIVNAVVDALPSETWLYFGYNAEFLFYPFSEHRSIGEMLAFHTEERRSAMLTYVVDVYAGDLSVAENAVSLADAWLDKSGYYARARSGTDGPKERQLDFHGGLRWRFEEHIDPDRRRIDRIGIVQTKPGLRLRDDLTWSDEEYNTYACPWHHNLTAAIVSFRTAKALRSNPASKFHIDSFRWHNSLQFNWQSQQLMDLGLMEPGQWF